MDDMGVFDDNLDFEVLRSAARALNDIDAVMQREV